MVDVIEVEFPPIVYPPPGLAYKTRLWLSRIAIEEDKKFHKRKRFDCVQFWNKIESCCRVGLELFPNVLRKEKGYDGIFRLGIRKLNYRFYGFFDGSEFIVIEAFWKPGEMGPLGREACARAEKVRKTGSWQRVLNERYPRPN